MIIIKNVEFLDNYRIRISLIDHTEILYDMKPKLGSARFLKLKDPEIFRNGKLVNNNCLEWGYNIYLYDYEIVNVKNFIDKYMA